MVLPQEEEKSQALRFDDEILHIAAESIVTSQDIILQNPPITEYTVRFNGAPMQLHGVKLRCTKLARKKLEDHKILGNAGLHGAFVLDGRVVAAPLMRWGILIGEEGFILNFKTKKECETLVKDLRDLGVATEKKAQQGEEADAGNADQ